MSWIYRISQKWQRQDWIQMVGEVFKLTDHPAGPFEQWTRPNLGRVTFMNEDQTISVTLNGELDPFSNTEILIMVSFRSGGIKSKKKSWPGNQIAQIPYDIVQTAYDLIDEHYNDNDNDNDNDNGNPQSPVNGPVLVSK